jgi:16S rRNA (cytosine967-C5)-methyltransferase
VRSPCRHRRSKGCWISDATAARRAALHILQAVRSGGTFQAARDRVLPTLAGRDRRLAYELAAGVLRRQADLDRRLSLRGADPRLHDVLRLGAYQLAALARVPPYAAVATSVELARGLVGEKAARYVNQALRKLQRGSGLGARDSAASHPRWLVERWRRQFGLGETQRLIGWNDTKPPVTLQPVRWSAPQLASRLQQAGFGVTEAPFGAGVRVIPSPEARVPSPARLPGFADGAFIVQDPAHALVCRYAGIPPGMLVYDACAAPGGKAVMLERAGARVVAGDARPDRIRRLLETTRRAGVAIRVTVADLLSAPFAPGTVPAVMLDAPCSATGTMARHPDARWRVTPRTIMRAARQQQTLLAAAATLVGPGGLLVYSTCSLEPEENGDIVTQFLASHTEFARAPVPAAVPASLLTPDGDLQSLPQRDGMDGAYAARLARTR